MTRKSTITKRLETLRLIENSGLTINAYFRDHDENPANFYAAMNIIIEDYNNGQEELKDVVDLYNKLKNKEHINKDKILDTDDRSESMILRDPDGLISGYSFTVYRRDKTPVSGVLSRDEMNDIYRLYSYYGANITQREVSRRFPDYSLMDFKRILRAFNITKASGPFAPHMYEEYTEDALKEINAREKENDFLKRIEKDELNDIRQTAIKLARKNRELEQQLENSANIKVDLSGFEPIKFDLDHLEDKSLILHLSDLHIGSKCESHTLYPNEWNKEEINRRLNKVLENISKFGTLHTLIINLLGDNLDGMDNQTARRDHIMPQSMDNMEQIETFLEVMIPFIDNCRRLAHHVRIYSVKCGNHDGIAGYLATLALKHAIEGLYHDVEFDLSKDYFSCYQFRDHYYILCHGKDEKFMKKGMPLNINDKTQVMIYEYLEFQGLLGESNIHVIKGDLHSNSLNSCKKFDYRNVLSLYGASDYSNYNFSRNSYGVSYDLFIGDIRTIGTFENF